MMVMSLESGRLFLVILGVVTLVVQLRTDTGLSVVPACTSNILQEPQLGGGMMFSQQPAPAQMTRKTAVVWTTKGITTECEAARVRHLVQTAGSKMDVWILHSHHSLELQGHQEAVDLSRNHIASIPGLHQWPQSLANFKRFDGASGSAKGSFLRFLVDHPEYDFAWHVENDMFFTGPWEDVFQKDEMLGDTKTDFIATHIQHKKKDQDWIHLRVCTMFQKMCSSIQRTQVNWMIARVSSRLAKSLVQHLFQQQVVGHHEAVIAPYCRIKKFKLGEIPRDLIGTVISGHTGCKEMDAEIAKTIHVASFKPPQGKLLHPIKCDAYANTTTTSMQSDIDKYTTGKAWNWWTSMLVRRGGLGGVTANPLKDFPPCNKTKPAVGGGPRGRKRGGSAAKLSFTPKESARAKLKRMNQAATKDTSPKNNLNNKKYTSIKGSNGKKNQQSYQPNVKISSTTDGSSGSSSNNNNRLFSLPEAQGQPKIATPKAAAAAAEKGGSGNIHKEQAQAKTATSSTAPVPDKPPSKIHHQKTSPQSDQTSGGSNTPSTSTNAVEIPAIAAATSAGTKKDSSSPPAVAAVSATDSETTVATAVTPDMMLQGQDIKS